MAFDGMMLRRTVTELREALDSRIDKIYQPSGDELVISLRKKDFSRRLLISVRSGMARMHFTETRPENPESPPMFCMLMRKHFSSARLISVTQKDFERVAELMFSGVNEMGDRVEMKIVCELIGNQSNVILLSSNGRIIDALRRSDASASRLILPGAAYEYPASQNKMNIELSDCRSIASTVISCGQTELSKALVNKIEGLSPLVAREISSNISGNDALAEDTDLEALCRELSSLKVCQKPTMLLDASGIPADFSYMPIKQYGGLYTLKDYPSFGELLEDFYKSREAAARMGKMSADIKRMLSNLTARANKRMLLRKDELKSSENREMLRIYGELIKANIYAIPAGCNKVSLQNFYDPDLSEISVPLDPALSAAQNAARYFKDYKKSYNAAKALSELIKADEAEIEYLETVAEAVNRAESSADIGEIRDELKAQGYIKGAPNRAKRTKASEFKEYKSKEGYRIIVGKNNTQNDYITTRLADKNDLWFHTKGIHGSHVVVLCGGDQVSDETVLFAAGLAAANSKASNSSNVPVDYTKIKNVKKPSGAKPGMVIYTTNKTVYVEPWRAEL